MKNLFRCCGKFEICLYLHLTRFFAVCHGEMIYYPNTLTYTRSVRIFLHFFSFTRCSCVSTKTDCAQSQYQRLWVWVAPSKSYKNYRTNKRFRLFSLLYICAHEIKCGAAHKERYSWQMHTNTSASWASVCERDSMHKIERESVGNRIAYANAQRWNSKQRK